MAAARKSIPIREPIKRVHLQQDCALHSPGHTENPSPSGDPYFADPRNIAELERRMAEIKNGTENMIHFQSAADAVAYFDRL